MKKKKMSPERVVHGEISHAGQEGISFPPLAAIGK
jgi:hypothetical protein